MATDFGTDVAAISDLPDPENLIGGIGNVAYAVARRWLTQSGALVEIGDTAQYTCFDIRDYFGARITASTITEIEGLCIAAAGDDPRVQSVSASVSFLSGVIRVSASVTTADGPFDFVLTVDNITAALMLGA